MFVYTNAWYVQCDINYFSLTHLQSILNKVILLLHFFPEKEIKCFKKLIEYMLKIGVTHT